jgi:DNA repair protein RadD
MSFIPRPYQSEAINAGIEFFHTKKKFNAFKILPTGSGKSLVIANVAIGIDEQILVLQPSKEILEQNFKKFISYGGRAGIYSASAGHKFIERVTFATIGSIIRKLHLFKNVKLILIDECDLVNAKGGMYEKLISSLPDAKVLGLTATPYRLTSGFDGAMLKFINRTNPRIFNKCIYYIQNSTLFDAGHLAKLEYFDKTVIDRTMLQMNTSGTDFTEASMKAYYRSIDMPSKTINMANRLLAKRKNLLVFCAMISEALEVAKGIPGAVVVTSLTEPAVRDKILIQFKAGIIRCVINVGVLTVGFDYPELEAILIARSTMSLRLYYQIVGRAMRPHPDKVSAWIVDLGGNISFFGKIETMQIKENDKGLLSVWNNGRQLTNVTFTKN